ncbi:hypothetical protein Y1Q_0011626 [Alligator mississippiensis]|uniref:Uncharacterized protein n=1 Tax=Alligator mississippiensis TaxID=8496 RepID=A0A151M0J1_ALLMI|nr:hypothetical protein Y1Q_0011626 [Alligator mississippiensis]
MVSLAEAHTGMDKILVGLPRSIFCLHPPALDASNQEMRGESTLECSFACCLEGPLQTNQKATEDRPVPGFRLKEILSERDEHECF